MIKNTIFSNLLKYLPSENKIKQIAKIHNTDKYVKSFTTYDHLLAMIFLQLGCSDSLRDIETIAQNTDILPNNRSIKRSTLHDANKKRDPAVFFQILQDLMNKFSTSLNNELSKIIKILDSTPIQIRGRGSDWAKEKAISRCQGLKVHLGLELQTQALWLCKITDANINDISAAKENVNPEVNNYYIFDKGYYDFNWWHKIHSSKAYFVTRLKKNTALKVIKNNIVEKNTNIIKDETIVLSNKNPRGGTINLMHDIDLRSIAIQHPNKIPGQTLTIITNALHLSAEEIAYLYKKRWEIELLFKFIKQNLRFKKFIGENKNAIIIQLITALIAYILILHYKRNVAEKISLNKFVLLIKQFLINNFSCSFKNLLL